MIFLWIMLCVVNLSDADVDISRPNEEAGATTVHISVFIIDIDNIDSANQTFTANVYFEATWKDPRLVHKRKGKVARPLSEVWNPRLEIVNQQKLWRTFPEVVSIAPDGQVTYYQRVWGQFSQPLKLHDFPFDEQTFNIQIAAAGYQPDEVALIRKLERATGIADVISLSDWEVLKWKAETEPYSPVPGVHLAGFVFSFEAKRYKGFFIIRIIIPLLFIVAMSWIVFWIDPKESGSQISVAITSMLTLIAYRFAIGTSLPNISYLTRIDYFILGATFLVFASLIEVIITLNLARTERLKHARWLDNISRLVFPAAFILISAKAFLF